MIFLRTFTKQDRVPLNQIAETGLPLRRMSRKSIEQEGDVFVDLTCLSDFKY